MKLATDVVSDTLGIVSGPSFVCERVIYPRTKTQRSPQHTNTYAYNHSERWRVREGGRTEEEIYTR